MSFGFGVGDFITVGTQIKDIVASLRGAEQEYQELLRELSSLQKALHHVDKLKASDEQQPRVNAIKCAALMCQHPLSEFLTKAQKFEDSLGIGKSKGVFRDLEKKARWGLCKKDDVRRLRDYLNVHVGSINMLLMAHGLEMLNVATEQATNDNMGLQKDLEGSRTAVLEVKEKLMAQQVMMRGNATLLSRIFGIIGGDVVPQLHALGYQSLANEPTNIWYGLEMADGHAVSRPSAHMVPRPG